MFGERPRGVTLRLLDTSAVLALAAAEADRRSPGEADVTVRLSDDPYAVAEHDGKTYVICVEGVGWEVKEDAPLVLPVYVAKAGHIAILPSFDVEMPLVEVQALAAVGEEVDLADHVRRFGHRLESNMTMWWNVLGGPAKASRITEGTLDPSSEGD